ncbi:MAG: pyridoxal-dependent decarboxylase [Pseudomonadota bacterium]
MADALERAYAIAREWFDQLDEMPAGATVTAEIMRARLTAPLPETGMNADTVIDELATKVNGGLNNAAGGRFFGWVTGGTLPSAVAADWLVSSWDQNGATFATSPALAMIEEVTGQWIKELLDLPRQASFAFTTGCQMAHTTSLAAARHAVLKAEGWNVEDDGLFGAPILRIVTSENRHASIDRALRYLGIGRNAIYEVATDDLGRIQPAGFKAALTELEGPKIAVLNAADLNVASFDDFATLIPLANEAGTWVHIDGAFGLFARASRAKHHLVEGLDLADSWSVDAHKWLNVPFDCGVAIIRDGTAHRAAMAQPASYIEPELDGRDQMDWTMEWSRRGRAIPVYAALRELGRAGVESMIDRCCTHCFNIVTRIGALPCARALSIPELNQGLIRFERSNASDAENDQFTDDVTYAINATGGAFFTPATWRGMRAMRVSVVNWRTTDKDVDRAVCSAAKILSAKLAT